jgi:phosphoribosylformimino-5-aminoimidazole carboxamide ribonucleotide (ProFAR) isomerase
MLLIIPTIELSDGQCTLCISGEEGTNDIYRYVSVNPLRLCKLWRREDAKALFIVDSDSFKDVENDANIATIRFISRNMEYDIPIVVRAKFKNYDDCAYMLDNSVNRIVILMQ